jgi:hypothetical protein
MKGPHKSPFKSLLKKKKKQKEDKYSLEVPFFHGRELQRVTFSQRYSIDPFPLVEKKKPVRLSSN